MNQTEILHVLAERKKEREEGQQMLHIRIPKKLHRDWKKFAKANKLKQQETFILLLESIVYGNKEN